MRLLALCLSTLALVCLALPVRAQSPIQGPLERPHAAAKSTSAHPKTKPRHAARKATGKADPTTADARPEARPPAVPAVAAPRSSDPANPLSLGMKWNGSNESAVQTRTQNYGGDAQGAGAAVGLKLHF